MLDYEKGHSVIQRLNEALKGAWSFEIVHHEVRRGHVLVVGRLTAGGITKMAFVGSQVTRARESGALVSLSDDLKAASTDGLKECATFLGVGLRGIHGVIDFDKAIRGPSTRRGCCRPVTMATTCTPMMPATSRWPMPST